MDPQRGYPRRRIGARGKELPSDDRDTRTISYVAHIRGLGRGERVVSTSGGHGDAIKSKTLLVSGHSQLQGRVRRARDGQTKR